MIGQVLAGQQTALAVHIIRGIGREKTGAHIPLHTVILGPIIRGQPKTNLKVTFEQESKQIRYSKYHIKLK